MAQQNTSPRQKMINMMYLVLTAMLALNVSSEILKAFHKLETSMENSGKNLDDANSKLLVALDNEVKVQGDKAKIYRDRAYEARKITDEFNSYIDELKKMFLTKNGGRVDDGQLKEADNMEASMDFFLNEKNGNEKGKELMDKINITREKLIALLDDTDKSSFKSDLKTEDPQPDKEGRKKTWLEETFEKLPLAATFANLTKYQNDAKKTESDVIVALAKKVNINDVHVNTVEANIVAPYSSISTGQTFTANVFLSGYNKNENYQMTMNGVPIDVKDGKGTYKVTPNAEGVYKYEAKIMVPDPNTGVLKPYTSYGEYQVFNPQASVSVANMRVFYAGIDNPVEITVPGYRSDQLSATADNATMTGGNGRYTVTTVLSQNHIVKINVVAKADDGSTKSFVQQFTTRPMPPLQNSINGKTGGAITVEEARLINFLRCDFGQYFPLTTQPYQVSQFTCYVKSKDTYAPFPVTGNTLTPAIKAAISKCKRGDLILFYDIQGRGANGSVNRVSNDMIFTIK